MLDAKKQNINLTHDVTFLHKSYGEWRKVEKSAFVPVSYKGSGNNNDGIVQKIIKKL